MVAVAFNTPAHRKGQEMTPNPLTDAWIRSKFGDSLYHARIKNHRDPTRDIIIELEGDSVGSVYSTVRIGTTELFQVNEGDSLPGFHEASQAALKEVQRLFQARRGGGALVMEFFPCQKMEEIADMFDITLGTASVWRNGGGHKMSRRSINQAMTMLGFHRSGSKKDQTISLHAPAWESRES